MKTPNLNNITSIDEKMSKWIKAANVDEINPGQLHSFECGDKKILLANLDGKIYATDLICTHAEADLSTGFLTPQGVQCPLHLSVFDLNTGEPLNPPAEKPLQTYNVKIQDNEIYVEV